MLDRSPADPRGEPASFRWSRLGWTLWSVTSAFGAYFCMYGFRKPFTVAAYSGSEIWGLDAKTLLVIAQVLGYTVSKFVGIRVVSEVQPGRRAVLIFGLILAAEAALVLFGLAPPWLRPVCLFLNGLPLGMVFGLVLGFLEGRRQTEALAAGLCASFILADGAVKSAGAGVLAAGVAESWMPAVTGLWFLPPLLLFVWMLTRIPRPSLDDRTARAERPPIDAAERRRLFRHYAPGLVLLVLMYLVVTVLRSVRADFAPEIWKGLGEPGEPTLFARSEAWVAAGVLLVNGSAVFIRDNGRAFFAALGVALAGAALLGATLLAGRAGLLAPFGFMVLLGLGLYLPYIAVHTTVFERLIAITRDRGNIGYLLYLADSWGYLGYVAVLLARKLTGTTEGFLPFFTTLTGSAAVLCVVLLIPCWRYFAAHPALRGKHLPRAASEGCA